MMLEEHGFAGGDSGSGAFAGGHAMKNMLRKRMGRSAIRIDKFHLYVVNRHDSVVSCPG